MVASALQIAQAMLLAARDQRKTVFLIDDAGAELDTDHNVRFFELLREVGGQILATTTQQPGSDHSIERIFAQHDGECSDSDENAGTRVFHVEHGEIRTSTVGK
jgi:recombinational DNA repair ATPase RecF